nr:VanZ family protein [Paenibacillus sp. SYP-B3998]
MWTLLIFYFSSQSHQEQSIQPILHKWFTKEGMLSVIPEITVHYHHATIEAKEQPYEFAEFIFRKSSHLFMYAVLAVSAYWALFHLRWRFIAKMLLVEIYVILIATADEWNQTRSVQRTSALQDIVLDSVGGLLGLVAIKFCLFIFPKIRRSRTLRRGEVKWQRK